MDIHLPIDMCLLNMKVESKFNMTSNWKYIFSKLLYSNLLGPLEKKDQWKTQEQDEKTVCYKQMNF